MGTRLVIATAEEFTEAEPHLVVHDGVPYCVVKFGGEVKAYVASCPHKDLAIVPLRIKKGRIVCPHHGATFDPGTGKVVDDAGKDVPSGLCKVDVETDKDGLLCIEARKKHRKMLKKKERKRVERSASKT